ncbi:MAG: hypothetical protein HN849_13995 [Victivallales bacterium]|nr:hypothetical protein [Victivallales bacterium]
MSTEKEEIEQIVIPEKLRKIIVAEDGTITIPVAACKSPKNGEKLKFMQTIDADAIQVHYSLGGGQPELLKFYVNAPKAGKYELTMHVCTVTVERSMLLRLNRRTMLDIAIPYTKGYWKDTEPLAIDLKEGRNTLLFTIKTPNKGISIKYLKLKPLN